MSCGERFFLPAVAWVFRHLFEQKNGQTAVYTNTGVDRCVTSKKKTESKKPKNRKIFQEIFEVLHIMTGQPTPPNVPPPEIRPY